MKRWIQGVIGVLGVAAVVLGAAATALADPLGPPPPPGALPESRCAQMYFEPHATHLGGPEITGVVVGRNPQACSGSSDWDWDAALPGLTPVHECRHDATSCEFKPTAPTGTPGHRYVVGCINGSSGFGGWVSCDYYGVVGKGCFEIKGEVTSDSQPQVGVTVYAVRSRGGGSAATDGTGHYSITVCHKGLYSLYADDHTITHSGGPFALTSFIFTRFKPASGECAPENFFNRLSCSIYVNRDKTVNFHAAVVETFVSKQAETDNAGSHLLTQSQKVDMLNTVDADLAASAVSGALALDATIVPEPVVSKAAAVGLSVFSLVELTQGSVLSLVVNYVDPFDPNYRVVARPKPHRVPHLALGTASERRVLKPMLRTIANEIALEAAVNTTLNRLASAKLVGDGAAVASQRRAGSRYLDELAAAIGSEIRYQRTFARLLHGRVSIAPSLHGSAPQAATAAGLSSLGLDPGIAFAEAGKLASAKLPRRVNVRAVLAGSRLLRSETHVASMLRAAARAL